MDLQWTMLTIMKTICIRKCILVWFFFSVAAIFVSEDSACGFITFSTFGIILVLAAGFDVYSSVHQFVAKKQKQQYSSETCRYFEHLILQCLFYKTFPLKLNAIMQKIVEKKKSIFMTDWLCDWLTEKFFVKCFWFR